MTSIIGYFKCQSILIFFFWIPGLFSWHPTLMAIAVSILNNYKVTGKINGWVVWVPMQMLNKQVLVITIN